MKCVWMALTLHNPLRTTPTPIHPPNRTSRTRRVAMAAKECYYSVLGIERYVKGVDGRDGMGAAAA